MGPEQEGQLSGAPVLSFAIKFKACAGLYVAGRGFRMLPPYNETSRKSGSGDPTHC